MPERFDAARRLGWARDDVARALRESGKSQVEARAIVDAIDDQTLALIRSDAVDELATVFIAGMRATIRITEALDFARGLRKSGDLQEQASKPDLPGSSQEPR